MTSLSKDKGYELTGLQLSASSGCAPVAGDMTGSHLQLVTKQSNNFNDN